MKLTGKLFSSYLIIVAVSLLVLALSTAYVAPENFSRRIEHMGGNQAQHRGADHDSPPTQGRGQGMMPSMMDEYMTDVEDADRELHDNFRQAVNNALF